MQQLLIKNVLHEGIQTNVLIKGNIIEEIGTNVNDPEATVIDGTGKAILPAFYNGHTHAGMTVMRGYADDMELFKWLNEYIWPYEANMTAQYVYIGSKLAILEMIKSGTVFFNDMYWNTDETIRAVEEMGVRAAIGITFIENMGEVAIENNFRTLEKECPPLVQLTVAPHAIYTVGEKLYRRCTETAIEKNLLLHTHLSETEQEVMSSIRDYGMSPVRYLNSIGVLDANVVAAHVVHANDEDLHILKEKDVAVIHNPCSNMKLSSGIFRYPEMERTGIRIGLGTDGCSSNNNLDMREEMKFASLLAKVGYTPETLPAGEIFRWATQNTAEMFGLNAGVIAEGKLADLLLIDMNNERMVPNYHLVSNWVYSANSSCIDTVICNGKILMQDGYVQGENEIIEEAKRLISSNY